MKRKLNEEVHIFTVFINQKPNTKTKHLNRTEVLDRIGGYDEYDSDFLLVHH